MEERPSAAADVRDGGRRFPVGGIIAVERRDGEAGQFYFDDAGEEGTARHGGEAIVVEGALDATEGKERLRAVSDPSGWANPCIGGDLP